MASFVDVSERSVISLTGSESLDLIQRISTNDVSSLKVGQCIQTVLTNEKGKIVDVLNIHRPDEATLQLFGQVQPPAPLISWLEKYIVMEDIKVDDLTPSFAQFVLHDSDNIDYAHLTSTLSAGCIVAMESWGNNRLGRVMSPLSARESTEQILNAGGLVRRTPQAFSEFRVLNAIPAAGAELTLQYNPLEAGLGSLISWTKGCYIGQEVIARLDTYKKVQRRIVKLRISDMPAELPVSFFHEQDEAGVITSTVSIGSTGEKRGIGYLKLAGHNPQRDYFFLKDGLKVSLQIVDN
ncbi:MAG: hypothetical protein NTU47_18190 [Ignavibacteriales bacterium]|nr:hypothetical protein [Ignavibacteriales bacterium]